MRFYSLRPIYFVLLVVLLTITTGRNAYAVSDDFLNHTKRQTTSVNNLPQWKRVIEDYAFTRLMAPSQKVRAWDEFMASIKDDPPIRQILKVNLWFNGFPYKQDNWIYNEGDYWASPSEFLENGGDCEDYAIIKYLTLRQLGFTTQKMNIAVVYDVFSGTDHAFLIVEHDDESFILDSRENMTVPSHYSKRYKPHFAFNEQHVWTYNSPRLVHAMKKKDNDESAILPGNR